MLTDILTLFGLALQQSKKLRDNELCELLNTISRDLDIKDFDSLKIYLLNKKLEHLYPTEKEWNIALMIFDKSSALDIQILNIGDRRYPKYLRVIDSPPPLLHIRGNIDCLARLPGVSVVGTRKISKNGALIARRIANYLADNNWIIVSGLAIGIDTAAHTGALLTGGDGNTIAVLAHGLEEPKPSQNRELAYKIIERGGLWVSEHPVGTPAKPSHFVPRNRIQLGLSVGSIIVEAEPNSGSVTQAKFCIKQKRPLYAVVPEDDRNLLKLNCSGTMMMVNEMGATAIRNKNDYPEMIARFDQQRSLMMSL